MKRHITGFLLALGLLTQFPFANSVSQLQCTCHGGPGNQAYSCPPVAKTCHGGPGNYPYTCYVCP